LITEQDEGTTPINNHHGGKSVFLKTICGGVAGVRDAETTLGWQKQKRSPQKPPAHPLRPNPGVSEKEKKCDKKGGVIKLGPKEGRKNALRPPTEKEPGAV